MARPVLPAYPSGWFQVADSADLKAGDVKPLRYFGQELVLTRGSGGEAALFDAHCPHLGAHIGYGGRLHGDSIECPFHGWRFGFDGRCESVPYSDVAPPRAVIRRWATQEVNGVVLAHYSRDGLDPTWKVAGSPEFGDHAWTTARLSWTVNTHPQEIVENIVDPRHFVKVHGFRVGSGEWEADGPILRTRLLTNPMVAHPDVEDVLEVIDYGLGVEVVRSGVGQVRVIVMNTRTPIEEGVLACHATFAVKNQASDSSTAQAVQMFVDSYEQEFRRDVLIWENKKYLDRPVITSEDGPIGLFRAWCKQFYDEAEDRDASRNSRSRATWCEGASSLSANETALGSAVGSRATNDLQSNQA